MTPAHLAPRPFTGEGAERSETGEGGVTRRIDALRIASHTHAMEHRGGCHCGNMHVRLVLSKAPEDCRRCPTRVVEIANALIANNRDREVRQLAPLPGNGTGEVDIVQYETLNAEAIGVANFVQELINDRGYRPEDILILAQRRSIGNPIYDALNERNIPSKSYYQENELESPLAQERVAIFKLFINPYDRIALRWLLGNGSGDFRTGAYSRLRAFCEENNRTPWDVMCDLANGTIQLPYMTRLIAQFNIITTELGDLRGHNDVQDFVDHWLSVEIEELAGLRTLVASLIPSTASAPDLLDAILQTVAQPDIPPDVVEVRIMSLHKSKGLSSPVVVIAGCIEGLLPAEPDTDLSPQEREGSLEEQRRLFYVGLTRVKANPATNRPGILLLTSSRMMTLADAMRSNIDPSPPSL